LFELKLEIGKEIRKGIQTQQANQTRPENPTAHPTLLSPKPSLSKPRPSISPLTPAGPANQPPACSHANAGPTRPHSLSPLRNADGLVPRASYPARARVAPAEPPGPPVIPFPAPLPSLARQQSRSPRRRSRRAQPHGGPGSPPAYNWPPGTPSTRTPSQRPPQTLSRRTSTTPPLGDPAPPRPRCPAAPESQLGRATALPRPQEHYGGRHPRPRTSPASDFHPSAATVSWLLTGFPRRRPSSGHPDPLVHFAAPPLDDPCGPGARRSPAPPGPQDPPHRRRTTTPASTLRDVSGHQKPR